MQDIKLEFSMATPFADSKILEEMTGKAVKAWQDLQDPQQEADVKGWMQPMAQDGAYYDMMAKADEIRKSADAFVLVGVGGSNQAARAVIKALQRPGIPRDHLRWQYPFGTRSPKGTPPAE